MQYKKFVYLNTQLLSLGGFITIENHKVVRKYRGRQLSKKVCGSWSAISHHTTLFNHVNSITVQVPIVVLVRIPCVPRRTGPAIHSVFSIWSLHKSCHSQHTAAAARFEGRHFLPVYACAHIVLFPDDRLLTFVWERDLRTIFLRV